MRKGLKIVSATELLKMKVKKIAVPYEDRKEGMRHCAICGGWVAKGIKHYRFPNPKNNLPSRDVCGGGCNTDWDNLKVGNIK